MLGDNPGVYTKVAQTEWWPFIPAIGVVVGVGLLVIFVTTTVMALKRESPASWAAASGLIAAVVFGFGVFGCAVAAAQYEERGQQHHDLYVAEVAEWVNDEIGGSLVASDATQLLGGKSVTTLVDGKQHSVSLEEDRSHDLLQLVIDGCNDLTSPGCGPD